MRPPPTTGELASRAERLLPSPIDTDQAVPRLEPSARWPIDLGALPPDCVHSSLTVAGGSENGSTAVASSTVISVSPVSTEIRSPTTGVLGLSRLNGLQPPSIAAAARIRAIFWTLRFMGFQSCRDAAGSDA